jgi:hypothetical protein
MRDVELTEEVTHFARRHVEIAPDEEWFATLCNAFPNLGHDVPGNAWVGDMPIYGDT